MNTWKVIAIALCILVLVLVAGYMQGCSTENSTVDPNARFYKVESQSTNIVDDNWYEVVDHKTGVHFAVNIR